MKSMSSSTIRAEFLRYFEERGHQVCSSYPLVPANDPTLLFTNAGMVQFKDVFTGKERRDFKRAASSQKCVRAGGKHNDLENVGFTARHHTFFEMLGNFSFGDYFKKDAIAYGWEFLVDWMKLDPKRLWVSVFEGDKSEGLPPDDEAAGIWQSHIGVPSDRILKFGKKDNFWSMGDTGPCGPCSEIHYDQGERVPCNQEGGCQGVACECDRFLEVWNLVFMQFNRDSAGKLTDLPAPSIDTGMGLERLSAVINRVTTNYDTDLFLPLIKRMGEICDKKYGSNPESDVSLRVVADHARATAFLMADGVLPSNEGRGYVLRRIMRRAIRHGHKLGVDDLFFHEICLEVMRQMGETYPELAQQSELLEQATRLEEETFRRTLDNGIKILKKEIAAIKQEKQTALPGKLVFDLQTRDGFPPDLTAVIARENGLGVDQEAYQKAWENHQAISAQGLGLQGIDEIFQSVIQKTGPTEFSGYQDTTGRGNILAILKVEEEKDEKGQTRIVGRTPSDVANSGQLVEMVISPTPFYGETGGQTGDTGIITTSQSEGEVIDTIRPLPELIVHRVKLKKGSLKTGESVTLTVDADRRQAIRLNHSATHLLQSGLRSVLGKHVNQKGSLVAPDRLRFDFSHFAPLTPQEIIQVENKVNELIRANHPIETEETDLEGARQAGATMLFGEKYDQQVRMVRMGAQSLELCGGTHAHRTGDIGLFKIVSEGSVQAGVRRIEALTGAQALRRFQNLEHQAQKAAEVLKAAPAQVLERLSSLAERERNLAREIGDLKQKLAVSGASSDPAQDARDIVGVKVLAIPTRGIQLAGLRDFADQLRDRMGGGVVLAFAVDREKLSAVCSVSKELTGRLRAGDLLKNVLKLTGGKGGGRPDFAQGGGGDPALMDEAVEAFYPMVEQALEDKT